MFDPRELPPELPNDITWGDKYGQAMLLFSRTQAEAYLAACVRHTCRLTGQSYAEAETVEKSNIAYWAGYYEHETRLRVEELFQCEHPILGPAKNGPLSPEEIFRLGYERGKRLREGETDAPEW
jgi:hypothetical protein